ncbi:GNAT family N-acetyltransferase [Polynucleobacter paneuropaeus]|uniref:GNAT family N-acetyltransferase n=1 Tax=Polynucleobacter paneuropaeus TaxID=2527775 RepID=UPI001BFCDDB7|nr:GNAT family N-acetyltransferase [Polynucleobacter paneuropaeus]MBT8635022.1 N-acetyltransferase [Polynucleobacter paneuropaeus]QWD51713.1 N-acetyltransferase [Polynucleobacter paneuropaeus]QWD54927.1 N-acetyltransferase [Polynucleobacter paneuropaeus]QWD56632.1 N-acetyltransferase [Polynucleobacter paneuropaeus]
MQTEFNDTPYRLVLIDRLSQVSPEQWDALLPAHAGPFLRHAFLSALEETECVGAKTGWQITHLIAKDQQDRLVGAIPLYLKQHSYGEFVFDWAWAEAYHQLGKSYYPKVLSAIPFTPVQGARILVKEGEQAKVIQELLITGLKSIALENDLSSVHILFPSGNEIQLLVDHDFMLRDSVQFHWQNQAYKSFEQFLEALNKKRRKNIRHERAQVQEELVEFQHIPGEQSTPEDWKFFYDCYAQTYLEHHSSPYLNPEFFLKFSKAMPNHLHLIIASQGGNRIASSLLVVDKAESKAYGRYWGALKYIPCLHFETAYYQALEYCISEGIQTFEGGAQGEHKMARGFMPQTLQSAHWLANPQFSQAVKHFLTRERAGMAAYVDELAEHSPLKSNTVLA